MIATLLILFAVLMACQYTPRRRRTFAPIDALDTPLLWWTKDDCLTVRNLIRNVILFGATGSGKTMFSGYELGRAIVSNPRSAMLIIAAKPGEDRELWLPIYQEFNRELLLFGPRHDLRFNAIDYEYRQGADARSITKYLMQIGETLRSSDVKGSGDESDFWEREQERQLYYATVVVMLAFKRVSAPELQRFINGAARSAEELGSDQWKSGFHNQAMAAAYKASKSRIEEHDYEIAAMYWLEEGPRMAEKTWSNITAGTLGLLHAINVGMVRDLISTETTVTPDVLFDGVSILVDAPAAEFGDTGNCLNAIWKLSAQRAILRRQAKADDPAKIIWVDEAQQVTNSFDAHFLAQCRSRKAGMVFLTQSIHSLYAAMKGKAGEHYTNALLTNFNTKIFHAVGDDQTANYAQSLIGRSMQTYIGGSVAPRQDKWDELIGHSQFTGSFSTRVERTIENNVFMNGLRTGGSSGVSDAIVIRSGEPFSNGENWLKVTFRRQ